jgi:hypothetical protein
MVEGPILPEDGQDQNSKRKFMSLLLPRIAASLFLPLYGLEAILRLHFAQEEELYYTLGDTG